MGYINVIYDGHVQDIGDVGPFKNGELCGTTGKSKRLEAVKIWLETDLDLGIEYEGQIQDIGWDATKKAGELCGTQGQGKRLESIRIRLTGADAEKYDVYYGVHAQDIGNMNWAMNGERTGTEGMSLRLEGIKIIIAPKGIVMSPDTILKFMKAEPKPAAPVTPAAPVGNLYGNIICINPGHGGSDPGACGDLRESDMNLTVALILGLMLTERGAQVVYTRTSDVHVYLSDRPVIANNAGADLFISIHHNGSSDPSSSGTCAICYPESDAGIRLAILCLNGLYNRLGLQQRGLIQRDDSDVTYTDMPAVITEASFASCSADCALFQNGGAELEALGILDGILAYFWVAA
ncbi:N-acetylmuramoyl-L-alanine amidase [Acetobacterium malicum]|uniref:N-acetylmuramoyl-L-alanine amidase n=1 Tax=Acetobacterium malicum TaxID=52692 RepID=UPI00040B496E|nr:N-acetylmuramoyl-L-alanine amidase [Acetobacterium dehalogenans]